MSNLFSISQELLLLRNQIEVEEEFIEGSDELQTLNDTIEIKREELSTKVEGYLHIIQQADAQADMGERELERVNTFVRRKERIATRLRAALLQALLLFGEEDAKGIYRMETGTHKLSTRRSQSVNILDSNDVPTDCKLYDVKFKNLDYEMKNFIAKRIQDLPESKGKSKLIAAFDPGDKISKTLIKEKLEAITEEDDDITWAEIETKYGLTIK